MAAQKKVQIIVSDIPKATRDALAADASARDVSRNDLVVEILSAKYKLAHTPTQSKFRPTPAVVGPVTFEVPVRLRNKLRMDAARKDATISGLVRQALAVHYGLEAQPPVRRRRQTKRLVEEATA